MRRLTAAAVLAALPLTLAAPAVSANQPATYAVTITNLTDGQPLTPALVATHKGSDGLFRVGQPASFGLREIAENGNLEPMLTRLDGDPDFFDVVVQTGSDLPPVLPGETITLELDAAPPHNFLSWASMLICTNDGFTGVDTLKLPSLVGDTVTLHTDGYDAGTELNTELFVDIVPPCGPLTGQDSEGQGTGSSDPALAEGGAVHHHDGILGVGDLDPATNDWDDPVAIVTVERVG